MAGMIIMRDNRAVRIKVRSQFGGPTTLEEGCLTKSKSRKWYSTGSSQRHLSLATFGILGFILGLVSDILASIGMNLLVAGVLLWTTAWFGREDMDWAQEVRFFGDILITFGGMACIAFAVVLLLT
jgi:hypothetical protein